MAKEIPALQGVMNLRVRESSLYLSLVVSRDVLFDLNALGLWFGGGASLDSNL